MKWSLGNYKSAAKTVLIFVAGIYMGKNFLRSDQEVVAADLDSKPISRTANDRSGSLSSSVTADTVTKTPVKDIEPALRAILDRIHEARSMPEGNRKTPLLKALEESTKHPLTEELLAEMDSIIAEGDLENSNYIISLLEQREDQRAVAFLLKTTAHRDANVAQRALFALEAIAGNVFQNRETAASWAATWQPDPERVKLFSPNQGSEADDNSDQTPRNIGPARKVISK